jgi:hypothetical protein
MATLRSLERARGYQHFRTPDISEFDHSLLQSLDEDDHPQYFNEARGDARYYTQALLNAGQLDTRYYTETEVDTLLSNKSDVGHTHAAADVVSGTFTNARISQSSVTQHQAALTITESQISDLQAYLLPADVLGLDTLVDPNDDRILFWDDSAGTLTWLDIGTGLTLSGTTLTADAGAGGSTTLTGLDDTNISGTQATGSVLYWNSTDWADTGLLLLDPAGGKVSHLASGIEPAADFNDHRLLHPFCSGHVSRYVHRLSGRRLNQSWRV